MKVMEKKKIKNNEKAHTAKKTFKDAWTQLRHEKTLKDRGDTKVGNDKKEKNAKQPDRGDTEDKVRHANVQTKKSSTVIADKKPNVDNHKKKKDKQKTEGKEKELKTKTREKSFETEIVKPLDLAERKILRDKYTFRPKVGSSSQNTVESNKDGLRIKINSTNAPVFSKRDDDGPIGVQNQDSIKHAGAVVEAKKRTANKAVDSADSGISEGANTVETETKDTKRRPIIKTVTYNNDSTKIYKAVTFTDQKRKSSSLKIKLPVVKKCKTPTLFEVKSRAKMKDAQSKVSVKIETKEVKKKSRRKKPNLKIDESRLSTEVARWDPKSVTSHTKLYYDAWLNTTLNPLPRTDQKDLEKENVIRTYKQITEGSPTPPYHYDYLGDEKYTGKIKITQR